MKKWSDDYKKLDLSDGKISFILEDDEDMIEIHYKDGMLIDVGYIERMQSYFITVVSSDTVEGWKWRTYSKVWLALSPMRRYILAIYRRIF